MIVVCSNKLVSDCCTGRNVPVCPYCHRVFRNASSDLRKHMWIHEGIKPFECHVCPYAFRTRSNLATHMLRHSADKPFLCNSCGKPYKSRTALRWHERSHVNGRMFKCDKYVWKSSVLKSGVNEPECTRTAFQLEFVQLERRSCSCEG